MLMPDNTKLQLQQVFFLIKKMTKLALKAKDIYINKYIGTKQASQSIIFKLEDF